MVHYIVSPGVSHLVCVQVQVTDYVNIARQFRSLCYQALIAEAEIPASVHSRMSLEEMGLNELTVIKVLSVSDEDTCRVTLTQIPQLARYECYLARYECCRSLLSTLLCQPKSTQPGHPPWTVQ